MSSLTDINSLGLPGLQTYTLQDIAIDGKVYSVHPEQTTQEVADAWGTEMQAFVNIINTPPPLSGTDATNFTNAVNNLKNIAINGVPRTDDPNIKDVLNRDMAIAMDQLFKTFRAAGIDPDTGASLAQVESWRNLYATSPVIAQIVEVINLTRSEGNRNLQALTELVYVKTGNEVMEGALVDLEEALESTKEALNILNELQQLHNEITVQSKGSFSAAFTAATGETLSGVAGDVSDFNDIFVPFADDFFGNEIVPIVKSSLTTGRVEDFLELKERIEELLQKLRQINGIPSGQAFETNTLGQRLTVVLNGIDNALGAVSGITAKSALVLWILDNYNTASTRTSTNISGVSVSIPILKLGTQYSTNASGIQVVITDNIFTPGQIQKELTEAITSAEALNDRQKEEVRRFLFVFEEYYKSASAILTKLTQLIEKMAQAISR